MKIGVSDLDKYKFSQQLIDHWKNQGHEVMKSLYHETKFVQECDVVYYEFASIAASEMTKEGVKPKKCIIRAIDIENYMNYDKRIDWNLVDHLIVLNNAHKKIYLEKGVPEDKIKVIPPGVNLNKLTLKKSNDTKKAVFVGRFWIGKNVAGAIEVVERLNVIDPGWELHLRGGGLDPRWWKKYVEYKIEKAGFPIHIDDYQEDLNGYLEDKSLMIMPSFKEAFSYVTAEAMAKGIPAVINDWYGSHDVWPKKYIYSSPHEAASMVSGLLKDAPAVHRKVVEDNYDENFMFERIDALL